MLQRFFKSDSEVYMSFGEPMDVFGNVLDEFGNSTKNGEIIDIQQHFMNEGEITIDKQRNDVYTRVLAKNLVASYKKENIVLSSHVISFVAFRMLQKNYPDMDIFNMLSLSNEVLEINNQDFQVGVQMVIEKLISLNEEGSVRVAPILHKPVLQIIEDGLSHLNSFHVNKPLLLQGNAYKTMSLKLLYFYHNRLEGYGLEDTINQMNTSKHVKPSMYN